MNKIAIVGIDGYCKYYEDVKWCEAHNIDFDIYIYPKNITELELKEEIEHLFECYCGARIARPLPPHIRHEVAFPQKMKRRL